MTTGRGRLNSIDLLPEEAEPDIEWALQALRARDQTQKAILAEFNSRLADRGIGAISSSAFNRHTVRLARMARKLEQTRSIATALTERLPADATDTLTIAVSEAVKSLIFEMLEEGDELSPKSFMEIARAMKDLASAQGLSTQRRRGLEKEFAEKASSAIDVVAAERGMTADTIEAVKARILGVAK